MDVHYIGFIQFYCITSLLHRDITSSRDLTQLFLLPSLPGPIELEFATQLPLPMVSGTSATLGTLQSQSLCAQVAALQTKKAKVGNTAESGR